MSGKYILLLPFCFEVNTLWTQSGIVTGGGQVTSGNGAISCTIGQIDYFNVTSPNASLYQGLQQPLEISEIVGIHDETFTAAFNIYPNPTDGVITLEMDETNVRADQFLLSVFDVQGRTILQQNITRSSNKVDISHSNSGLYIFRITNSFNQFRTFRIIKK